jgi:hypothetical protein
MTMNEPLTGAALIAKVKTMPGASKSELVRACGYVSAKKDGGERLNFTAFYEAMAVAQGAPLPQEDADGGGRKLTYATTVLTTGAILIGKRYVELLGLKPGDKLRIMVTQGKISLVSDAAQCRETA